MCAVVAINEDGLHAALSLGVSDAPHASVLPWIFDGVGEHNV